MRPLLLLAPLLLSGLAYAGAPLCDDDYASCKESCVIEFGTALKTRDRVLKCVATCQQDRSGCEAKFAAKARQGGAELEHAAVVEPSEAAPPEPAPTAAPARAIEPSRAETDWGGAASRQEPEIEPARGTASRPGDVEPASRPQPAASAAEIAPSIDDAFDGDPEAPPAAPAPAPASRSP